MIPVKVTIRTDDNSMTPHVADGFAPFEGSPLAVVNVHDVKGKRWTVDASRWHVVHTPTGYFLGARSWDNDDAPAVTWADREFAFGVLNRCNPAFPAWLYAKGGEGDLATLACKAMFRAAVLGGGSA